MNSFLNKISKTVSLKKILLMFVVSFCFTGSNVFAADNVLQAIQVDGVADSYNIILKSDDVAEVKKTIQAPNKMVLNLHGIRASKTINTIYNNTASVDSVVVEPTGEDSVKILIQADNASNAEVHFDTLKTPLGVLDKSQKSNEATSELVLNGPMNSYKPVYDESADEEETEFSMVGATGTAARYMKKVLKSDKLSWMVVCGLLSIIILGGMKSMKDKDSNLKVGLAQSLKEREIDLYRGLGGLNVELPEPPLTNRPAASGQNAAGANYGMRAYQNGTRSSYLSSEVQRPRPMVTPAVAPAVAPQAINKNLSRPAMPQNNSTQSTMTMAKPALKAAPTSTKPKTTNIDSIKFLESMTKIYEKNGRSDLAQGLKANMKKAKANLV